MVTGELGFGMPPTGGAKAVGPNAKHRDYQPAGQAVIGARA